jgi:predicted small secreted protein
MKRSLSVILSFLLMSMLVVTLTGCGQDIKAENEKLKAENAAMKSDVDKMKSEIGSLKDQLQKAAEKDATIGTLTAENEVLKKQLEDLKASMTKKKK